MPSTVRGFVTLASLASLAVLANAYSVDYTMGSAAFLWPPDRVWSEETEGKGPCGGSATGDRTKFPLTNGKIALIAVDNFYNTKISISFSNDPTSDTDFVAALDAAQDTSIAELHPGHTCVSIPDQEKASAGAEATLQLVFTDTQNQTFYACSDITFVEKADFKTNVPCFNATTPGKASLESPSSSSTAPVAAETSSESGGGRTGLSSGAVAALVVVAAAGFAL